MHVVNPPASVLGLPALPALPVSPRRSPVRRGHLAITASAGAAGAPS
jgi:hypothetical protein